MEELDFTNDPQPEDNGLIQPLTNDLDLTLGPASPVGAFDKQEKVEPTAAPGRDSVERAPAAPPEGEPSGAARSEGDDVSTVTESVDVEHLDLTYEVANQPGGLVAVASSGLEPAADTERWNSEKTLFQDRRWVALLLLWILVGTTLSGLLLISTTRWTQLTPDQVSVFFGFVFTSVVALVGAVTGFYFGTKPET